MAIMVLCQLEVSFMTQFIKFRLQDKSFAIDVSEVQYIEFYQPATHLPGSQDYVHGVIHLRNQLIPIVDLRIYFGFIPNPDLADARIIISANQGTPLGLLVDSIPDVFEVSPSEILSLSEEDIDKIGIDKNYLSGKVEIQGELIGIFRMDSLEEAVRQQQRNHADTVW